MAVAVWTNAQIIAQLDSLNHWNSPTITYSTSSTSALIGYVGAGDAYNNGIEHSSYSPLNATQANIAALAITLWDDLIPQSFVAVNEAAGKSANIDLAGFSDAAKTSAYAYTLPNGFVNPDGVTGTLTKSTVWVNDSYAAGTGDLLHPAVDNYGFMTYMHELGHAIGLDHMGNYNGNVGSGPSSYQDSLVYSIMSYYGPNSGLGGQALGVAWANWGSWDPQTPMLDDVLAIQSIYGVSTTTRVGESRVLSFGVIAPLALISTLMSSVPRTTLTRSSWLGVWAAAAPTITTKTSNDTNCVSCCFRISPLPTREPGPRVLLKN